MTTANEEQAEFWAGIAPVWRTMDDHLDQVARIPGEMAMDRLGPIEGKRVLDIGCGTGGTTVELARRVGPTGAVVGADIADEMLTGARERAETAGTTNVTFIKCDAQVDKLGSFDAAFSRFGVMFFADPVTAFANIRRAIPDGMLSFVCWQGPLANEWMALPTMAAISVIGAAPPIPEEGAPGPFSLSDPERVRSLLGAAGYRDINVAARSDSISMSEAQIADVAHVSSQVGGVRRLLLDADDSLREKVTVAIESVLRERLVDGEAQLSRGFLLVAARA